MAAPAGGSFSGSGSLLSDDEYSHFSGFTGEGSVDTIADLLSRFTVDAQPDCTLKLRSGLGPVVLGADLTRIVAAKTNTAALVVKPAAAHRLWRRLRVDTTGTLTLRSQKIRLWLFTLDVTAHANPRARSFDFSYRLATKWDVQKGEYRNKKRMELGGSAEARAHWSISYSLPAIEGSMGTGAAAARRAVSQEVHADVGYAHLDIPRLELVVWPRGRPTHKDGGGGGSGDEEGAGGGDGGGAAAEHGGGSSSAHGRQHGQQPDEHPLPEYFRGIAPASGSGSVGSSLGTTGRDGGRGKSAALQQLNSHVACLSGRWWDALGGGRSSGSGGAGGT